jgi:predicted CoA-binding protein
VKETKGVELRDGIHTGMNFAVLARADRFQKRRHAYKVWRALREFGCRVYLVAPDLDKFENSKVYSNLLLLRDKIDVVIPCLRTEFLENLVDQCVEAGAKYIWFQEKNWTAELAAYGEEKGLIVIRGCCLKHKSFKKPWAFFNPCYWHGRREKKVPVKHRRI